MNQWSAREIFGAEIQYFRLEPRYWERVLEQLRDTGLRCVTTYVPPSVHMVTPQRVDFTGRTDPRRNLRRFLELVQKHQLRLNFRAGPFVCNEMVYGGYPAWLVLGDPQMMVWDYQNRPAPGYWIAKREGSQPSYLHPTYLEWCRQWCHAVGPILRDHLATRGGCVHMVNLDNEVSYITKDGFLDSDYNPVNVRPGGYWEQFLHLKYGRRARLRPPPREVPGELRAADFAAYADWCEFKTWVMCEYLRRLRGFYEEQGITTRDVTFMTNFNPHLPEGVPTRMPALEAATGGIAGYDFYRGTFLSYSGYQSMARVLKLMNASLRYTWSAEFMSGTWNKVLTSRVSDDHMRFMARCALAQGCKAITWFMFHDRDCWGDAPVSAHGHRRPSWDVLRETVALVLGKIRDWDALRPQTDVAVLYDLPAHQHTYLGDPSPCNDQDIHVGAPWVEGVEAGRASVEYAGLFRLIEHAGVQPGVVDLVHSARPLANYRLAFLPGSPVVSPAAFRALRRFVREGGVLVVSGPVPKKFLPRGQFIHCDYLAQNKPEQDSLASIEFVARLIRKHAPPPHVRIQPEQDVCWVDWQPNGGSAAFRQPRNLGSAVLHRGPNGETILFVLNHYPEAVRFRLQFPRDNFARLVDLDDDAVIPVRRGVAVVDVDRKSGAIYRCES